MSWKCEFLSGRSVCVVGLLLVQRNCNGNSTQTNRDLDPLMFCLFLHTQGLMPDKRQGYEPDVATLRSADKQLPTRPDVNISSLPRKEHTSYTTVDGAKHTKANSTSRNQSREAAPKQGPQARTASTDKHGKITFSVQRVIYVPCVSL